MIEATLTRTKWNQNLSDTTLLGIERDESKLIFENIFCYNTPQKQLRVWSSTRPPAGLVWCHVPPTQQPSDLLAKERVPCPARLAGSVVRWPPGDGSTPSPGWTRIVKNRKPCTTRDKLSMYPRKSCFTCTAVLL